MFFQYNYWKSIYINITGKTECDTNNKQLKEKEKKKEGGIEEEKRSMQ